MLDSIEYIFVDESGNTDINGTAFYVICGVLCPSSAVEEFKESANSIVTKHAGSGELKSSTIGGELNRRKRILTDIAECSFSFYCLVVDKSKVFQDSGLYWKRSFYKFLHRMFYNRIVGSFTEIRVLSDVYGKTDFMTSFKAYIQDKGGLFNNLDFQPSSEVPLLQIADVIGGSVRRVFEKNDPKCTLDIIGYPSAPIELWPPLSSDLSSWTPADISEHDKLVYELSVSSATKFTEANITSPDIEKQIQAEGIRYLLLRFQQNPKEYVFRNEVIEHLKSRFNASLSDQVLSSRVIAPARDAGVILASTEKGVKIAYSAQDLHDWIKRVNSQTVPYLDRVQIARNKLLMASHSNYDIIDPELFPSLVKYFRL